jgi:hypothetical protein
MYQPTASFMQLPDYEPFATYADRARKQTLAELQRADLAVMKRVFVYAFGAAEGMMLDRMNPDWRNAYFQHLLSTDELFAVH